MRGPDSIRDTETIRGDGEGPVIIRDEADVAPIESRKASESEQEARREAGLPAKALTPHPGCYMMETLPKVGLIVKQCGAICCGSVGLGVMGSLEATWNSMNLFQQSTLSWSSLGRENARSAVLNIGRAPFHQLATALPSHVLYLRAVFAAFRSPNHKGGISFNFAQH
jgi:hypothetical protein